MTRRLIPVLAALTTALALTLTTTTASAAVLAQLGRTDRDYYHYGNPALGGFHVAVAGEVVDSNDNGVADSLGGATRLKEISQVTRGQIDRLTLGAYIPNSDGVLVWTPLSSATVPINSGAQSTVNLLVKTPAIGFCGALPTAKRIYQVRESGSVRWTRDYTIGRQSQNTAPFEARMLANDPGCVTPPPPGPSADLRATKTASETSVASATPDAFTYTIAVTNLDATDNANSVTVTDTLPAEVDLTAGGLPANCTLDSDPAEPDVVTCTLGTVLAGETETVVLGVVSDPAALTDGTVTNTARVTSSTDDPNAANNTSTVALPIRPLADVAVAKTATQASVTVPGDAFRYVLTATNSGPSTAGGVLVFDVIPAGLTVNETTLPTGCAYNAATRVLTCTIGTLAAGASVSFSIDVTTNADRADDTAPYVNTARIATTTYEVDTADNVDTLTLPVSTA